MSWEMDRPLNFHGNSEVVPQPISCYNTPTLGVDKAAYQAAQKYENNDGKCRHVTHHLREYCPCIDVTEIYKKSHGY